MKNSKNLWVAVIAFLALVLILAWYFLGNGNNPESELDPSGIDMESAPMNDPGSIPEDEMDGANDPSQTGLPQGTPPPYYGGEEGGQEGGVEVEDMGGETGEEEPVNVNE